MNNFFRVIFSALILAQLMRESLSLDCLVTTSGTTATATCSPPNNVYCKIAFPGGVRTASCAETCTASANTACCTGTDCNEATSLKTCLQCSSTTTCASTTVGTACLSDTTGCITVYDASGIASIHACGDASDVDSNTEYCTGNDCNKKNSRLNCLVCGTGDDCATTTSGITCLLEASDVCKTVFNSSGSAIRKSCEPAHNCVPDEFTSCCTTSNCNTAKTAVKCYQCSGESACVDNLEATPCASSTHSKCKGQYDAEDNNAFSKTCSASADCTQGNLNGIITTCCTGDGCNILDRQSVCFQCNSATECSAADLEPTVCISSTAAYCKILIQNGQVIKGSCEDTCPEFAGTNGTSVKCCPRGVDCFNSGITLKSSNVFFSFLISAVLIAFKKFNY